MIENFDSVFDEVLKSWLGRPYNSKGRSKTSGTDCVFFPVLFFNELFEKLRVNRQVIISSNLLKAYDRHFFHRSISFNNSLIKTFCDSVKWLNLRSDTKIDKKGYLLLFGLGPCSGAHLGISTGIDKFVHNRFNAGVLEENLISSRMCLNFVYEINYVN